MTDEEFFASFCYFRILPRPSQLLVISY